MLQPYIGNTKISKLYKGNELWCNWSSGGGEPVDPDTFETIIFCQSNNNINLNGTWSNSSYQCFSGTKSLYTSQTTASITSNVLTLPAGNYKWSTYHYTSSTCRLVFIIEGDYSKTIEINSGTLTSLAFNTITEFNISSTSKITLKLSASYATTSSYCRFYDWKLEKIS